MNPIFMHNMDAIYKENSTVKVINLNYGMVDQNSMASKFVKYLFINKLASNVELRKTFDCDRSVGNILQTHIINKKIISVKVTGNIFNYYLAENLTLKDFGIVTI